MEDNKEDINRTQINQIPRINRSDSVLMGNNLNRPNEVLSKPLFFYFNFILSEFQKNLENNSKFRYIQQYNFKCKQWRSSATKTS